MSKTIYQHAVETWGEDAQLNMLQEECAELIVARNKYRRTGEISSLIEELVDVQICCAQTEFIINDRRKMNEIREQKIARLWKRLEKYGVRKDTIPIQKSDPEKQIGPYSQYGIRKCLRLGEANRFGEIKKKTCHEYHLSSHREKYNPDFSKWDYCDVCKAEVGIEINLLLWMQIENSADLLREILFRFEDGGESIHVEGYNDNSDCLQELSITERVRNLLDAIPKISPKRMSPE